MAPPDSAPSHHAREHRAGGYRHTDTHTHTHTRATRAQVPQVRAAAGHHYTGPAGSWGSGGTLGGERRETAGRRGQPSGRRRGQGGRPASATNRQGSPAGAGSSISGRSGSASTSSSEVSPAAAAAAAAAPGSAIDAGSLMEKLQDMPSVCLCTRTAERRRAPATGAGRAAGGGGRGAWLSRRKDYRLPPPDYSRQPPHSTRTHCTTTESSYVYHSTADPGTEL